MKKLNYFIVLSIVLFNSCEEKIDLKIDQTYDRLVVEGMITTETKSHIVKLTKTASYFSNESTPKILNAKLSISDGNQITNLDETAPGIYATNENFKGEIGKTYTLKIGNVDIDNDGVFETYEASSIITKSVVPDSLSFEKIIGNGREDNTTEYISINLWAYEPETLGNNYLWDYYVNGKLATDTINKVSFTEDEMVNGKYIADYPLFYSDKIKVGDTITLRTASISRDYLEFLYAIMSETRGSMGNFGGPPANIKGNISNGALGFFNTMDINNFKKIVKLK